MERLVGNWWALAIRGAAGMFFGALAVSAPEAALLPLFGGYALLDGGLSIAGAWRARWWAVPLASGVLGMLAGAAAFLWPAEAALVVVYLIAAWSLFTGALELAPGARMLRRAHGDWLLLAAGLVSLCLGLALFAAPGPSTIAVIWSIGACAAAAGAARLSAGLHLRQSGSVIRWQPQPAR